MKQLQRKSKRGAKIWKNENLWAASPQKVSSIGGACHASPWITITIGKRIEYPVEESAEQYC